MKWKTLFHKFLPGKKKNKNKVYDLEDVNIDEREEIVQNMKIKKSLDKKIDDITGLFGNILALSIRRLEITEKEIETAVVFMSGLSDTQAIQEIIEALQIKLLHIRKKEKKDLVQDISKRALNNKDVLICKDFGKVLKNITMGSAAILIDGIDEIILCETKGFEVRNISEPENEMMLRGPRDGFVENIFTNTSLIRQRIRIPHLWIEGFEKGSLSKVNVAIAYIKGLASEELVEEVRARIEKIDIDAVLESGYIEEYIIDQKYTIFPQVKRTERPDKVISSLLEGKVSILIEGTPFVLILPVTFEFFLQAPDDYYEPFPIGSFIRFLRYTAYFFSILLPGIYVAILNYHSELLPVELLMRISATREGIPFPVIIEALIMESLFEILREAGIRLPKAIGQAVSIVGALILGEAAVNAGLASPPMIIVVALTAISSFTVPDFSFGIAARLLRFIFLFFGGILGLFGVQFGVFYLLIHLCALRSFGQPYFQPFGPLIWQDLKDGLIRLPWWLMIKRPKLIAGQAEKRQQKGQGPKRPTASKGEIDDEK